MPDDPAEGRWDAELATLVATDRQICLARRHQSRAASRGVTALPAEVLGMADRAGLRGHPEDQPVPDGPFRIRARPRGGEVAD
ncbi:hypothetical protein NOCA2270127 [metagenome]|uniref:Uncharacterized protein n=1 Tax=metagenome TaxID=256318 RepID=A0A2P2C3Z9_9ZZZZ